MVVTSPEHRLARRQPSRCAGRRCFRTNPHGLRVEIPAGLRREDPEWYLFTQPKPGRDLCRNEQAGLCIAKQHNIINIILSINFPEVEIHVSAWLLRGNAYVGLICVVVVLTDAPAMADCQRTSCVARVSSLATVLVSESMLLLRCKRQKCRPTV